MTRSACCDAEIVDLGTGWGRCLGCGDDSFPMTYEAAYGYDPPNGPADLGWRPEHRGPQPRRPQQGHQMPRKRDEQSHPECGHAFPLIWSELPALAIDTETTGPDPDEALVVELGAYWCPRGKASYFQEDASRFGTLINPGAPIPEAASRIHGIWGKDVADAPFLPEVADRFLDRIRAADVLVAYNHFYDWRVLERALGDAWADAIKGKVVLDPLTAVRARRVGQFWKGKGRHKLDNVAKRFGIPRIGKGNHRASSDAALGLGVLYHLDNLGKLPTCAECAVDWLATIHDLDRARFKEWKRNNPRPETEEAQP